MKARRFLAWNRGFVIALSVAGSSVLAGCGGSEAGSPVTPQAKTAEVLARVGGHEITRAEIEAKIADQLGELDRKRYELVEQGLEAAVVDRMLETAASAEGLTPEAYVAAKVDAEIRPVSDSDVDRLYEQRKDEIGQPKAAVAQRIRQYLGQVRRQEAMSALVATLRAEFEPEILLEPMRVTVATAGAPSKGPESAPVTIVEFSDFQCPFCSRLIPTLDRVTQNYPESVRLVFRQFPLNNIHQEAQKAAEASLCAADQGKFWEMHDAMFENQDSLAVADLKSQAVNLGLDAESFDECLDSGRHADRVRADLEAGAGAGVTGTPALFINGRFLSGAQPYEAISKVIDDELRRAGA